MTIEFSFPKLFWDVHEKAMKQGASEAHQKGVSFFRIFLEEPFELFNAAELPTDKVVMVIMLKVRNDRGALRVSPYNEEAAKAVTEWHEKYKDKDYEDFHPAWFARKP